MSIHYSQRAFAVMGFMPPPPQPQFMHTQPPATIYLRGSGLRPYGSSTDDSRQSWSRGRFVHQRPFQFRHHSRQEQKNCLCILKANRYRDMVSDDCYEYITSDDDADSHRR